MSGSFENTRIGGVNEGFQTTCWTQMMDARTSNEARQRLIVEGLLRQYWKPVYCYLRRKGYHNDKAKDLTQGFFMDIVLQRDLFQQANPQKGKFRSFLLTALNRFVIDQHRHESARQPSTPMVGLDDLDLSRVSAKPRGDSPEACFNHAWIADLLEQVMLDVKRECQRTNIKQHWQVFEDRMLIPILKRSKPLSLPSICEKYGIDNERIASNMIVTVKRRLKKALERNMRKLGDTSPEMNEQVDELLRFLES